MRVRVRVRTRMRVRVRVRVRVEASGSGCNPFHLIAEGSNPRTGREGDREVGKGGR